MYQGKKERKERKKGREENKKGENREKMPRWPMMIAGHKKKKKKNPLLSV